MDIASHGVGQAEQVSGSKSDGAPNAEALNLGQPGFVCIGFLTQIILNQQKEIDELRQQVRENQTRLVVTEKNIASTESLPKRKLEQDPVILEGLCKLAKRVEILEAREKQVVRVNAVPVQDTPRIGVQANILPTSNSGLQQERYRNPNTANFSEMMEDTAKWVNGFMKDFGKLDPDTNKWQEDRRMFESHVQHIVTPEQLQELLTWKPDKEATMQNAEKLKWQNKYLELRNWAKKYKIHRECMRRSIKEVQRHNFPSDEMGKRLTRVLDNLRYCQPGGRPFLSAWIDVQK